MPHPGVNRVLFNPDQTFVITAGASGFIRAWDGENAAPLSQGTEVRRGVEAPVVGPGPRRVIACLQNRPAPVIWDVPIEGRPVDEMEALSILLSGHLIDSGEGLSIAPPEAVQAAQALVARREPSYFAAAGPKPAVEAQAVQARPSP